MTIDLERHERIIRMAFLKLIANFNIKGVRIKEVEYENYLVKLYYTYHINDLEVKATVPFGYYWFDTEAWKEVLDNSIDPSDKKIEEKAPSTLDTDEDTKAMLRVAARLFELFKSQGLIK